MKRNKISKTTPAHDALFIAIGGRLDALGEMIGPQAYNHLYKKHSR